ncbi:MAG: tRNA lysidine(34) synthetase TilS [Clostridia bacterium]|nr:tRNA lysidine(34) synthetase TilS [Clostridia bacterium]
MDFGELKGKRICVALSGGADSVCLLYFLKERVDADGFILSAVHCQHGIRGADSLADAAFCEELCLRLGVTFFRFDEDCVALAESAGESLETAARGFRQRSFRALTERGDADFIATAHHREDEAETDLFRLARGTALAGVKGMTERDGFILRPILSWSKAEILRFLEERGAAFCEDKTNFSVEYTRNKLRLGVLPMLEEAVPGAARNLVRFASLASEDDGLLQRLSGALVRQREKREAGDSGFLVVFSKERALFRRAVLTVLKGLGLEKDYTAAHLESVFLLQALQVGSRISLPYGIVAVREYDGIGFLTPSGEKSGEKEDSFLGGVPFGEGAFAGGMVEIIVEREGHVFGEEQRIDGGIPRRTLRFDWDSVPENAVLRYARAGDRFEKFGGGSKSLKKYLIDRKIPQAIRGLLPIVAEKDGGEVFAVCGVEIGEQIKVTVETQRIGYIRVNPID